MTKTNRVYQIDLLRFIAALSVVLYHYLFRGWTADNMSNVPFNEVSDFFKYGYLGVDLFFIISGFVITLSIKHNSITKFVISRLSRLYPTYWICVSITYLTIITYGYPEYSANFKQFLLNLTMFQNYLKIKPIDGVYWSLFVEMKFYIFVIGAFLILNKIKKIKIDFLIVFWLLLSSLYIPFGDTYAFKVINFFLILNWSSYFISGMIFYLIYKNGLHVRYLILISISLYISLHQAFLRIPKLELHHNTLFSPLIIGLVIFLFYLIMFLIVTGRLSSINSKKFVQLGMLTYPLYLLHQNVGFIIMNNLHIHFNKYLLVFVITVAMIIISLFMSKYYEPKVSKTLKKGLERLTAMYIDNRNLKDKTNV